MMTGHPGPNTAKQVQIMILQPPCFTDEIRFLCCNAEMCHYQVHRVFILLNAIKFVRYISFFRVTLYYKLRNYV